MISTFIFPYLIFISIFFYFDFMSFKTSGHKIQSIEMDLSLLLPMPRFFFCAKKTNNNNIVNLPDVKKKKNIQLIISEFN